LQESITLIAYDRAGMAEAVGTLYELLAGIGPLTPLALPRAGTVRQANKGMALPAAKVLWSATLPDGVIGLKAAGGQLSALTHAGVRAALPPGGQLPLQQLLSDTAFAKAAAELSTPVVPKALADALKKAHPRRLVKFVVPSGKRTAVAYWGGAVQVTDENGVVRAAYHGPQDVTALAWWDRLLVVGDADGRVTALAVD
jgi:hypothetical protein